MVAIGARDSQTCDRLISLMVRGAEEELPCDQTLERVEISMPQPHKIVEEHGAIVEGGRVVPGHFGKEARSKRKR